MLRISIHDDRQVISFQLEGKLAGPWLRELERCWQIALAPHRERVFRVDLTGVTYIDDAGKACLASMLRQGAELLAADCLTRAIVAELTQLSFPQSSEPTTTT